MGSNILHALLSFVLKSILKAFWNQHLKPHYHSDKADVY